MNAEGGNDFFISANVDKSNNRYKYEQSKFTSFITESRVLLCPKIGSRSTSLSAYSHNFIKKHTDRDCYKHKSLFIKKEKNNFLSFLHSLSCPKILQRGQSAASAVSFVRTHLGRAAGRPRCRSVYIFEHNCRVLENKIGCMRLALAAPKPLGAAPHKSKDLWGSFSERKSFLFFSFAFLFYSFLFSSGQAHLFFVTSQVTSTDRPPKISTSPPQHYNRRSAKTYAQAQISARAIVL